MMETLELTPFTMGKPREQASKEWDLSFLGFKLYRCNSDSPHAFFVDDKGDGWAQKRRLTLVSPDPEKRGEPLHLYLMPPPGQEA